MRQQKAIMKYEYLGRYIGLVGVVNETSYQQSVSLDQTLFRRNGFSIKCHGSMFCNTELYWRSRGSLFQLPVLHHSFVEIDLFKNTIIILPSGLF